MGSSPAPCASNATGCPHLSHPLLAAPRVWNDDFALYDSKKPYREFQCCCRPLQGKLNPQEGLLVPCLRFAKSLAGPWAGGLQSGHVEAFLAPAAVLQRSNFPFNLPS